MKSFRNHLMNLGAVSVLVLGVALAQDQAPQPPAVPIPAQSRTPLVTRRPLSTARRPTVPGGAAEPSAATASSASLEPTLDKSMLQNKSTMPGLKYKKNPIEIVLMDYALVTGKTLLTSPGVQPQLKNEITLESQEGVPLTREEYLDAIESVLSMNGIVLEPFGEKFLKVLPFKTVRTDGIRIQMDAPDGGYPEKSQVVSQMIQLKSIAVSEAQKAIEGFKTPDGLIQTFERTRSLLVTDTQENVNRMLEIIKFIDQPQVVNEEVNVRMIRFAKIETITKILEEIRAESQKQNQAKEEIKANASGSPGFSKVTSPTVTSPLTGRPLPPGLSRLTAAAQTQSAAATPNATLETPMSDADRGMITGKVLILSDERSRQLIIITSKENMIFFDRVISVLDVEVEPDDPTVEVLRLEFADAEEVSTMLNDLIGNASAKKDDDAPSGSAKAVPDAPARSTTLAEAAAARASRKTPSAAESDAGSSKLSDLNKDNIKILADKRTNAIVMMGTPSHLARIKGIIKNMDIQLSQVLIETVVLEVSLGDKFETGIDWVRRMKPTTETRSVLTGYDETTGAPIYQLQTVERDSSYRYGASGGAGGKKLAENLFGAVTNAASAVSSGYAGLEYMATFKKLRLDTIIQASKSDSQTKVLSSPVLLTVDNKEATIEATDLKYMYKGMRYMGYSSTVGGAGSYEPDIEQRDVGLTVKVTPRINPTGNVMLTIEETFENAIDNGQQINGETWPTVTTRKISADVSVGDGETVVLGGLVKTSKGHSESGVPILKDIPYIGKYLFGKVSESEDRSELLVFLTPYVINDAQDMDRESRRRKDYINATDIWTKGWSDSKLADPVPAAEMKMRLERKKEIEKAWKQYRTSLENHYEIDDAIIDERTKTEALIDTTASANFAKEQMAIFAATNVPSGTLRVSETVEVLGPRTAPDGASQKDADGTAPEDDKMDTPSNKWWKLW